MSQSILDTGKNECDESERLIAMTPVVMLFPPIFIIYAGLIL